jgi:transposase
MAAADPQVRIEMLEAALRTASRELHWANLTIRKKDVEIRLLEERLRKQRIGFLGPASESLTDLQLELLTEEEPSVTREEVEAESRRKPISTAPTRTRKPHPGRKPLPENLPRVEEVIGCEANCTHCGGETRVIGYDLSEVLDREPAKWFVRVTKREKRSCGKCSSVQMPALSLRIVEKGLASDRVIVETVVAKYCDHLPLYRQEAMIEREAGVEISRATLDGWVMRVGELLQPIAEAMRADLLRASYIQADETIVPVQMHDGRAQRAAGSVLRDARKRGSDHQAYLWQYGAPGGETVFDFQLGRGRDGPAKFLKDWNGILQTDGYQAYDRVGGPGLIHVGCWTHARRKFVDAVKVNPQDGAAIAMVTRMDALFLVDRHARQQQLNVEERAVLRREHAHPWVDEIHSGCDKLRAQLLPKSALGEAVHYTLNMWAKLRRCFDHAEVELSNNVAENSMRPVALGRKNWLHVGSEKSAGPKVAAILSVVESCRRLGVPVKDYLLAVLPGLNHRKYCEAAQLTPARWKASRRGSC